MKTMTTAEFRTHAKQMSGFHIVPQSEVNKSFKGYTAAKAAIPGEDFLDSGMTNYVDPDFLTTFSELMSCNSERERTEYIREHLMVFPEHNLYKMAYHVIQGFGPQKGIAFYHKLANAVPEYDWEYGILEVAQAAS